ncbi:hypothetical protein [Frisingicoccus sp.]|uniref:hypothetical protein n=1 Tax=Frisingicoccus sp. TaxID=1918627 RepID=UPI003AB81D49
MKTFDLQEVAGGALQEKLNRELQKVFNNMMDPNTPWKNKRQITVKMTLEQNEDRDDCKAEIQVETKLAPVKSIETRFSLGRNLDNGEVEAAEYGPGIKGQMSMDEYLDETKNEGKVIDMRQAQ